MTDLSAFSPANARDTSSKMEVTNLHCRGGSVENAGNYAIAIT